MAQPTRSPAPASPPASSGGEDLGNQFLLSGKFIAALFVTALILAALSFFADLFGPISLIVLALAICALCYRLRLAMRFLICALVLAGISLYVARPMLSETFYDVGLKVLSSYGDPGERAIWPDPARRDLPDTVVTEVPYGDGLQGFDTTTAEGRVGAISGLKYETGARYLGYAAAALLFTGLVIACLGTALRLLGVTREPAAAPASTSRASGLFSKIGRDVRVGLAMVAIGWVLFLVGGLPQDIFNGSLPGGVDYLRGEGINSEAAHLFWPMMILDKVQYMGGALIWMGIAFSFFPLVRRAWRWACSKHDHYYRKLGFALVAFGTPVSVFSLNVLPALIIPTVRETAAPPGDFMFLSSFTYYPEWLRTSMSIMDILGPACIISGILFILFGENTLPWICKLIAKYFSSWFASPGRPSSSGSPSSSERDSGPPTLFDGRPR